MILKNPTTQDVTMSYLGIPYFIEANGVSANIPNEVAYHWINKIHGFLQVVSNDEVEKISKEEKKVVEEVKEVKEVDEEVTDSIKEIVEATNDEVIDAEEVVEEVKEEKTNKKANKNKNK